MGLNSPWCNTDLIMSVSGERLLISCGNHNTVRWNLIESIYQNQEGRPSKSLFTALGGKPHQRLWSNWGKDSRMWAGLVAGAQSDSRKAVGYRFAFLHTGEGGGGLVHYRRTTQQDRNLDWNQPETCLLFKKAPPLPSVCAPLSSVSLRLGVIREPPGRMISCHPQWWPSTECQHCLRPPVWMSRTLN